MSPPASSWRRARPSCWPRARALLSIAGTRHTPAPAQEIATAWALLLLDRHLHAAGADGEVHALVGRGQPHAHSVLVLHRDAGCASGDGHSCGGGGVVAVEVVDLGQTVDLARRGDRGRADRADLETADVD